MIKKTKQRTRQFTLEPLEDRTLLSTAWVPLDQVLMQGITQAGLLPPLSALNFYSPDITHNLTPPGQFPPGAVPVGLNSETGEEVFAVADKYIVQINVTGLSGAAAADPNQLLRRAQGELVQAKLAYPTDKTLTSVSIDKYVGAGRYLVTAGVNSKLDSLNPELDLLPGFKNVMTDLLFPSDDLKTANK